MRATTKCSTDIFTEHAYIGSLAATHAQSQQRRLVIKQFKLMDDNLTRLSLQRNAGTRIFIKRLAIALERRMHRWYLLYLAAKALQHCLDLLPCCIDRTCTQYLTFGIAGIRGHAQVNDRFVFLVSIQ